MAKASILIVDDDESILETLSIILEDNGYSIDIAKNGEEAIKKSMEKFYNLALLDIKLPDMEGTKLLTKMKETRPKMVKIMITGYASLQNAIDALNLGAEAYIMKPLDPEGLLKTIEEKLKAQEESEKMTQGKVTEWIESRVRKLETERRITKT